MYAIRGAALSKTHRIPSGQVSLEGELRVPEGAAGVVLFAHGSGSSRHSPRNQFVAGTIREEGVGTLLFDLLTPEEAERIAISVGITPSDHLRHTVNAPTRLWLKQTNHAADEALEIESTDGTKTLLRFRSAMPAEMVDGLVSAQELRQGVK